MTDSSEKQEQNDDPGERLSALPGVLPPELREVAEAWDRLSAPIRAAVLALVRTADPKS